MEMGFTSAVYVVAPIPFILSLGGLSGQESAKQAVWYGIVGMALAVTGTSHAYMSGQESVNLPVLHIAFTSDPVKDE